MNSQTHIEILTKLMEYYRNICLDVAIQDPRVTIAMNGNKRSVSLDQAREYGYTGTEPTINELLCLASKDFKLIAESSHWPKKPSKEKVLSDE